MRKKIYQLLFVHIVLVVLISFWTGKLVEMGKTERLKIESVATADYREQRLNEEVLSLVREQDNPGRYVGIYLLESKFGYQEWENAFDEKEVQKAEKKWKRESEWKSYIATTEAIWNDVTYFPVPEFTSKPKRTVSYVNTWMCERTYGGKRGHEGTDLMASENVSGLYPIISMTDGVVTKKGWLEKGGYRIGIESPGGVYFYYAHLHSYADIEVGDKVKAGDIIGYMGDTGYGPEGTTGKFAVHLHLGIYIYPDGKEVSINPYWILRYIEKNKVKCYTEM